MDLIDLTDEEIKTVTIALKVLRSELELADSQCDCGNEIHGRARENIERSILLEAKIIKAREVETLLSSTMEEPI